MTGYHPISKPHVSEQFVYTPQQKRGFLPFFETLEPPGSGVFSPKEETPMPVVRAYKRLSKPNPRYNETREEAKQRLHEENHYQTQDCKSLANMHGRGLKIVWYEEIASTLLEKRPRRDEMLHDCNSGDIIVASAISRFQRNGKEAWEFWDWAKTRKVTFWCADGQTNEEGNPNAKLTYSILSAVHEWERNVFSERWKAINERRREKGLHIGRNRKTNPEVIEQARELMAQGMSLRGTAKKLNMKHNTLWKGLKIHFPEVVTRNGHIEDDTSVLGREDNETEEYAF